MSESANVFKGSVIYAVGNFGSKILSLALVSVFSFYLTKSEYGTYDLILTSIAFLAPIVTLQLGDAVYRDLYSENDFVIQKEIISNALVYILAAFFIFATLFIISSFFVHFLFLKEFILLLFFSCLQPFLLQVVRGIGKKKLYAGVGILNTFSLVLFCLLFLVVLKKGLWGLLVAAILANGVACITLFLIADLKRYLSFSNINENIIKRLIKYSGPLVPNTISWFLITMSDRFIILFWMDMSANGIFAVSTKYPSLIMMINSVFILAIQDHAIEEKSIFNSKFFNTYVRFSFLLVNLFILISPILARYALSSEFYEAWKYMPLLYIATVFMAFSSYLGAYYLKFRNTVGLFYTTVIGGVCNIFVSGGTMPFIGLYAPALGSLVSFLLLFIMRYKYIQRKFSTNIKINEIYIFFALSILCTVSLFLKWNIISIGLFVICSSLFLLFNKQLFAFVYRNSLGLILRRKVENT